MMKRVLSLYVKNNGHWDHVYDDINSRTNLSICDSVANYDASDLTFIMDSNYPNKLKEIMMPPFFLFHYGNMNLLKSNNVIGINFVPSVKDLEDLTSIYSAKQNLADIVICIPSKWVNLNIICWIVNNNYKLIVIQDQQLENFKFKDHINLKKHLVVSEFNYLIPEIKKCADQFIERLLFAFSDHLFIKKDSALFATNQKLVEQLVTCNDKAKNKKFTSCHFTNNILVYTEEFNEKNVISDSWLETYKIA